MSREIAHSLGFTLDRWEKLLAALPVGLEGPPGPEGQEGPQGDPGPPEGVAVILDADVSQSTTGLQDVAGLSYALEPNTLYKFLYLIRFRTAAVGTGIALGMNGPLSPTFSTFRVETPLSATAAALQFRRGFNVAVASPSVDAANADCIAQIEGVIRTGLAGGTLLPRYASEVAGSLVTVKQYSCGFLTSL
jgi:hypothetical protein